MKREWYMVEIGRAERMEFNESEQYLYALKKAARWDEQISNEDYYYIGEALIEAHHRNLERNYNGGWGK